MDCSQKEEYRYAGSVETRSGSDTWKYNGEITYFDAIGTTFATSCQTASRNILYKYVTQKLRLNPDNMWKFRLTSNPKKVEKVGEQVHVTETESTVPKEQKFVQMSIFDII